jgi:heptosyltransferase-2
MAIFKQIDLEVFEISPNHKKILWINISAPSLGDSLMDLSSRVLLHDRDIDLYTSNKNAHIYFNDDFFDNIFIDDLNISQKKYDLVILDSYSSRSMQVKVKVAKKLQYVGMYGFFNGPEVNRTLFSFHQMNSLLGSQMQENQILQLAKNHISISNSDKELVRKLIPEKYIAIALGGEWEYKTFNSWNKLIYKIIKSYPNLNIVLIGSRNAQEFSLELSKIQDKYNLYDLVAKLSFNQTAEVIRNSNVFLCCDGGLLHAANSFNKKVVTLFAKLSEDILLTESCNSFSLYDKNNVNNIPIDDIYERFVEAIND